MLVYAGRYLSVVGVLACLMHGILKTLATKERKSVSSLSLVCLGSLNDTKPPGADGVLRYLRTDAPCDAFL